MDATWDPSRSQATDLTQPPSHSIATATSRVALGLTASSTHSRLVDTARYFHQTEHFGVHHSISLSHYILIVFSGTRQPDYVISDQHGLRKQNERRIWTRQSLYLSQADGSSPLQFRETKRRMQSLDTGLVLDFREIE